MYVLTIVCAALAVASANPTCTCPADDPDVIQRLNDHDAKINKLIARTQAVKDTINRRKEERADADKDSKNMLLRLNKLDISAEEDKCPKKHFKCVTGGDSFGKRCVANLLVCDGTNDCLDGSDEDPNLCKFPMQLGEQWHIRYLYNNCSVFNSVKNGMLRFTSIERSSVLASDTKLHGDAYYKETEARYMVNHLPIHGIYRFADQTIECLTLLDGALYHNIFKFVPGQDLWEADVYRHHHHMDPPCCKAVITRDNPHL